MQQTLPLPVCVSLYCMQTAQELWLPQLVAASVSTAFCVVLRRADSLQLDCCELMYARVRMCSRTRILRVTCRECYAVLRKETRVQEEKAQMAAEDVKRKVRASAASANNYYDSPHILMQCIPAAF